MVMGEKKKQQGTRMLRDFLKNRIGRELLFSPSLIKIVKSFFRSFGEKSTRTGTAIAVASIRRGVLAVVMRRIRVL